MKQAAKTITLKLNDKQLVLLARAGVQSMFDMVVNGKSHAAAPLVLVPSMAGLPEIGADYDGGKFAGLTLQDNRVATLTLLPGDEKMTWNDGVAWAEKQGGVLPSRFDQLVLFKNLKKEFQETWYWSGEQRASDSDCAWGQYFANGYQYYGHKSGTDRVRAVRRSVIQ